MDAKAVMDVAWQLFGMLVLGFILYKMLSDE